VTAAHGGDALQIARRIGLPPKEIKDFSLNVNPFGPPAGVYEALTADKARIKLYPDRSYSELKEAIASALGFDVENIVVGCGGTELIHSFMLRLVRRGRVAVPLPTFSEYEAAAASAGIGVEWISPRGTNVDLAALRDAVACGGVSGAVLCNPNNPTGELLDPGAVGEIIDISEERGVHLLVDEAYLDLSDVGAAGHSSAPRVAESPFLLVLRSLTKPFGFPGLRVGYGLCHPATARALEEDAVSWRVGTIEERAAIAALGDRGFLRSSRERLIREKAHLLRRLRAIPGLKVFDSGANFFLIDLSGTGSSPRNLKWRLLSHCVLVRELSGTRGIPPTCIRVCVRGREDNERLVDSLRNILAPDLEAWDPGECGYRPCHFPGQDCRLCLCPFYPCLKGDTGGRFVVSRKGGMIWSCEGCSWIHLPEVAEAVIRAITGSGIRLRSSDQEAVLKVREKVLEAYPCPPSLISR